MRVLQIVPRLPPLVDGVGDYAVLLAEGLSYEGVVTDFLVGDPHWTGPGPSDSGNCASILSRSSVAFELAARRLASLGAEPYGAILLHYVGYGYAKRGTPLWLAKGVSRLRSSRFANLIVIVHEAYATALSPLRSSFWLGRAQRLLLKAILRQSALIVTTHRHTHSALLGLGVPRCQLIHVPGIPSNVGEPESQIPHSKRAPRIVVFGGASGRRLTWERHSKHLLAYQKALGVSEVLDVGPPICLERMELPTGLSISCTGVLPSAEVSALLSSSRFGLLSYQAGRLAKSGIFASYCSHEMTSLVDSDNQSNLDGLVAGIHYLTPSTFPCSASQPLESVASQALLWYQSHSVAVHVAAVAGALSRSR